MEVHLTCFKADEGYEDSQIMSVGMGLYLSAFQSLKSRWFLALVYIAEKNHRPK